MRRASMRMSKQERLKRKQEEDKWRLKMMYDLRSFFGVFINVALQLGQVAAVTTCMLLSLKRLKKQDYVEPQQLHQDDHRNISLSLNIFYSLVVAQGIIFICILLNVLVFGFKMQALQQYRLFGPSGHSILNRYVKENYLEFISGNIRATLNTDLVTFANNLSLSSSVDDQLVGIRAMDRILRAVKYRSLTLLRLRASLDDDTLKKLVNKLGFIRTTEEQAIRGHAARVVLKLTPDLLVQKFPEIFYLIFSSLLTTSNKMDLDLLWFGLRILDKLTDNPENCRQPIKDDDGDILLKIVDLITNHCDHGSGTSNRISNSWIEQEIIPILEKEDDFPPPFIQKIDHEIILGMSLSILSKLLAASLVAGAAVFMREKSSQDFHFLTNSRMILNHFEATRVISCLAVDEAARREIGKLPNVIENLKDCLLSKAPYLNFSKVAAKLLLLEYTASDHLDQLKLFINENNILQDQSFSLPVSAFIQELHMHEQTPMQSVVEDLDLEDVLSGPRVNHSEEAAKALILLTTECENNVEAFLQEIKPQELEKIVKVLSSEEGEKDKRKMMAHFEGRNLDKETLCIIRQIICVEGEEHKRSMHAKLLQNLRAYSGTIDFNKHMQVIDQALPMVFKAISDGVLRLEDQSSTNKNHSHENSVWIKEGKVIESFIGLAVQICRSQNAIDFAKTLGYANVAADTLVKRLKKILELYNCPTIDFPCIRRSTIELLTWIVEHNNNNIEILLQCGVYEQLNEVAKTARKLESFKLFHSGVGVPTKPGISCISSLSTELQQQLQCSPNFNERSCCYRERSSTISVLID
ncbi:hypothetical protein BDA96_02G141700 [Sorghum bicolor]|nr:hypothetical protein BDA96_02G141700 [Sorghum bicolor]